MTVINTNGSIQSDMSWPSDNVSWTPADTTSPPQNYGACPHCGYCPHCGRRNQEFYPYNPYPWIPSYPIWYGGLYETNLPTISISSTSSSPAQSRASDCNHQ